jgi:hypothetical protein
MGALLIAKTGLDYLWRSSAGLAQNQIGTGLRLALTIFAFCSPFCKNFVLQFLFFAAQYCCAQPVARLMR